MNQNAPHAEAIRRACIEAGQAAFEDARWQGLCCEGAWECAVDAMRHLNLESVMQIQTKRVYESAEPSDGYRVLVDRVWPRGVKKDEARIDRWLKVAAPSSELRKWFNHEPDKWADFKKQYSTELRQHKEQLRQLLDEAGDGPLTLVYSARDERYNNAITLREYLHRMKSR